eukprot:1888356-Rhodomonas_salina.2
MSGVRVGSTARVHIKLFAQLFAVSFLAQRILAARESCCDTAMSGLAKPSKAKADCVVTSRGVYSIAVGGDSSCRRRSGGTRQVPAVGCAAA